MGITTTTLESSITACIEKRWPWVMTVTSKQLIAAYAAGSAQAFYKSLAGITIASGVVSGGAAAPSGPVGGALLTYSPGVLSSPDFDLESVFVPPQYRVVAEGGKVLTGEYTPWLKCFTATLSQTLQKSWAQFIATWSLAGLACVGGGSANWVASTPPVPGPWVSGTITAPFVFVSATTGVSAYAWAVLSADFDLACRSTTVTLPIQASDPISTRLVATDSASALAKAISGGISDTITSVIGSVTVYDPSGSGGSGIAAPGGIVTGTLVGAKLNLAA